ncbi:ribbon-helix-helix domain-containing protein [Methylorubrum extorquens]
MSITREQDDLIRVCLNSGRFASTSKVVRAALRLIERDETREPGLPLCMAPAMQLQDRV